MHSRLRVRATRIAVFGLVALHAVLLAQRIRDCSIAEPSVLARWGAAVVLGVAALVLSR
ncbi:MAG: hypothetical protein JOZ54_17140, partial [Acidobacteria bacterium]|nr:hypothetical protein [Acidobacteriota bacterium]